MVDISGVFAAVDLKSITNLGAPKCPKLSYSGISKFFYDIQVTCTASVAICFILGELRKYFRILYPDHK